MSIEKWFELAERFVKAYERKAGAISDGVEMNTWRHMDSPDLIKNDKKCVGPHVAGDDSGIKATLTTTPVEPVVEEAPEATPEQAEEPSPDHPLHPNTFKNMRAGDYFKDPTKVGKTGFAAHLFMHQRGYDELPQDWKEAVIAKWVKVYPTKPFPLLSDGSPRTADKASEPEPAEPEVVESEEKPEYSVEQVREALISLGSSEGRDEVIAMLTKLKNADGKSVTKVSEIQEKDYSWIMTQCGGA